MRKILSIAAAVAASGLCTPAMAADLWLDSQHAPYYGGDYTTSLTFQVGGANVRVSAWTIDNQILRQASLGVWDQGLGVRYGTNDNSHTVDNSGTKDFILFQFDRAVQVDFAQLNTGWHNMNDTDAQIGIDNNLFGWATLPAWNGTTTQTQLLSLLDVKYVSSSGDGNSYRDINPTNATGNMWLIGAAFTNPDYNKDGFKIERLTVTVPTVTQQTALPEPSTWAMMLIGFFGLGGAMRSRRNRERSASSEVLSAA